MKKGKKAALAVAVAVIFLVACGGKSDAEVSSGEIIVPEMSSEDLIVSSLEYLLEEDNGDTQEESTERSETPEVTESAEPVGQQEVPEEETEPQETAVVIWYGADTASVKEETIEVEELTPEALISALARHNIVPLLDTKVLSLEEQEQDGGKLLYLDLSDTFREYLLTMSREAECIIISSVSNTFLANYDADAIYITVEGESLTTSHAEYIEALEQCTPEELMEMFEASDADETQSKLPLIQEKE